MNKEHMEQTLERLAEVGVSLDVVFERVRINPGAFSKFPIASRVFLSLERARAEIDSSEALILGDIKS